MLSTFISNPVIPKIEFCKCLRRDQVVMSDINERVAVKVLCYVLTLEQDVEHLHLQSCYRKDWVGWVSKERSSSDVWYKWKGSCNVTVLCFNAWARCRAPSSPIELYGRLSCVIT